MTHSIDRDAVFRRSIPHPFVAVLMLFALAVAATVGGAWILSGSSSSPSTTATVSLSTLRPSESGDLWSVSVASNFQNGSLGIPVVAWGTDPPTTYWIDARSGAVTAKIESSHSVTVLQRPSAGQLLISDATKLSADDGILNEGTRLLIFDLEDGLKLIREFSIPDRIRYTIYGQPLALSSAEDAVFYIRDLPNPSAAGCMAGDWRACNEISVVRVDLESATETGSAVLPTGCFPTIRGAPDGGVIAACGSGLAIVFDADMFVVSETEFGPAQDRLDSREPEPAPLMTAYLRPDAIVGVFRDGTVVVKWDDGHDSALGPLDSAWLAGPIVLMDDGTIGMPLTETPRDPYIDAYAFVDVTNGTVRLEAVPRSETAGLSKGGTIYRLQDGVLYRQRAASNENFRMLDMGVLRIPTSVASIAIVP